MKSIARSKAELWSFKGRVVGGHSARGRKMTEIDIFDRNFERSVPHLIDLKISFIIHGNVGNLVYFYKIFINTSKVVK